LGRNYKPDPVHLDLHIANMLLPQIECFVLNAIKINVYIYV